MEHTLLMTHGEAWHSVWARDWHERHRHWNPFTREFAPLGGYIGVKWHGLADEITFEKN